jgi:4-amino-4-deoxy-L-arabinose transferase-like glycosyltransferase
LGFIGVVAGLALMTWTWSRAASMSADGAHYMELAERSWRLGPHAGMDWYAGPGYPVIAGWLYALVGDLDFAGRLTSFLFGLATLAGVALLGHRMFGSAVATIAVALLAAHTTFVRHAVMAETDAAYGCWLVWSIFFTWELKHAVTIWRRMLWATLAACTLGVGYLTRPEAVPLAGLLGLWYVLAKNEDRGPRTEERPSIFGQLFSPLRGRAYAIKRIAYAAWVGVLFLAIASPYMLKLRADLGRWSLSGKERSIVLKFVPDKRNYEEVLKRGVTGALIDNPWNVLHWLPYHMHWGLPQFVKSLHPIVLVLAAVGLARRRVVPRAAGATGLLLWTSVPFVVFFVLTFPGRRYFMQAMPAWTILAAVGTVELAAVVACWRQRIQALRFTGAAQRAWRISLAAPLALMAASTAWSNRRPIEESLRTERAIGERIFETAGAGRRVLTFSVAAFYARGERVPLWGPMGGIVRCHGYGERLSYDDFVRYVRRHRAEFVVLDHDLRADCPEFLQRVCPDDFELLAGDIADHHGPHLIYRFVGTRAGDVSGHPLAN